MANPFFTQAELDWLHFGGKPPQQQQQQMVAKFPGGPGGPGGAWRGRADALLGQPMQGAFQPQQPYGYGLAGSYGGYNPFPRGGLFGGWQPTQVATDWSQFYAPQVPQQAPQVVQPVQQSPIVPEISSEPYVFERDRPEPEPQKVRPQPWGLKPSKVAAELSKAKYYDDFEQHETIYGFGGGN